MRGLWFGIAALSAVAGLAPVAAQYREGTPEVLAPRPRAVDPVVRDAAISAAAYAAAGSPRIVVFWNRELTDRLSNDYDAVVLSRSAASGEATASISRNGRHASRTADSSFGSETRVGRREVTDDRRDAWLGEDAEWQFLDGFQERLQGAGLRLVDRQVAMRALAASPDNPGDKQAVEMQGIARLSDLMMTIVQTPATGTPLGVRFKVTVSDIHDGSILATVISDGSGPPPAPGRFVAGTNGFERERSREVDATVAGTNVARALLARLAARWQ